MLKKLLFLLALYLCFTGNSFAQQFCDPSGNVIIYSNYDGGVLNINCDVNIPNLKIGVVTYEPVTINILGTFAANVTEVRYAGYVATNNNHCPNSPTTTTITGAGGAATSVNFMPAAGLNNPNGYNMIICNYSCDINVNQGGCNTADQVMNYFLTTMGGSARYHFTQYGCWSVSNYNVSNGGNCCAGAGPPPPPCTLTVDAGLDVTVCPGVSTQLNCNNNEPNITTCVWSPAAGLDNPNICNPIATPSVTTPYVVTCTDTAGCVASDTIVININQGPGISCTPPSMSYCQNGGTVNLNFCFPTGGIYSGPGVSGNVFDPSQLNVGQTTVHYAVPDSLGCLATSSMTFDILAPTVVTFTFADDSVCVNDSAFVLTGAMPAGGTYSGTGVSGGMFDPGAAGAGAYMIYYNYPGINDCPGSDSAMITVVPNPPAPVITQIYMDSIEVAPSGDAYQWYQTGVPYSTDGPIIFSDLWFYYTVSIMIDGCWSPLSDSVMTWSGGISDPSSATPFKVYPNPGKGIFQLEWPQEIQLNEILVFDALGKMLLREHVNSNSHELNLNQYSNGNYWVVGRNEDVLMRSLIVIVK